MSNCCCTRVVAGLLLAMCPLLMTGASSARAADGPGWSATAIGRTPYAGPARLDVRTAWTARVPSGITMYFTSYHLLEGRVYGIGTDGAVVAIRADNGEIAWLRRIADEFDAIRTPRAYHSKDLDAVVFTLLHDVLLLDARNGVTLADLDTPKAIVGPVAVAPKRVFVTHPGGTLGAYRLKDDYVFWRVNFVDALSAPPVYVPGANLVVAVDRAGLVAGLKNEDRADSQVRFSLMLGSKPSGEPAVEDDMLYISTENQMLHAIQTSAGKPGEDPGRVIWQYRLAAPPTGGPVLTATAIYQATRGGGLQRIAKVPGEFRGWYDPDAVQFLAEWPTGVVVLRADGTLALIDGDPRRPVAVADAGPFDMAISNPFNDAIYLANARGMVRCLRPAGAAPLEMASFLRPLPELPEFEEYEPAIDKLRRQIAEKKARREGRTEEAEMADARKTIDKALAEQAEAPADATAEPAEPPPPPRDPFKSQVPVVR